MTGKILTVLQADSWVAEQRSQARRVGFTCGAFDLLHAGHVEVLEKARALCDVLLVAVNSDDSIRAYKSPLRPIVPENQRMKIVSALVSVDAVVKLDDERPLQLLERWRPEFYFKGGDYGQKGLRSSAFVESYGGKIAIIPFETDQSTSSLIRRIVILAAHNEPATVEGHPIRPVVFLDRDGTLIRNVPYLHEPARLELLPGVGEGLKRLQQAGYRLVIVTNQQGIGLGYVTLEEFYAVNHSLFLALAPYGVRIDRIYFCPHSLAEDCYCRKPKTGMLQQAISFFKCKPQDCWMLGDSPSDAAAGQAAGCQAILLDITEDGAFEHAVSLILQKSSVEA